MDNDARYEYLHGADWVRNDRQSFSIDYTENIAAAYGIVAANLGRWSLVAGLRGEYTHTTGKQVGQDYFSLFPNANISYSLSKDGAYSLIAQYARTISRPSFWCLSPQRSQISDYTYQTGNPALKPSYTHDASLTFVLKHKYTLSAGVIVETDEIQQTILPDADDPDLLCVAWVNYDAMTSYYLTASLPFQLTRWWQLNVNAMAMRHAQRVTADDPVSRQNLYSLYAATTFTLPANFYIDLSYRYQSRVELGNCWVEPQQMLHAGIKNASASVSPSRSTSATSPRSGSTSAPVAKGSCAASTCYSSGTADNTASVSRGTSSRARPSARRASKPGRPKTAADYSTSQHTERQTGRRFYLLRPVMLSTHRFNPCGGGGAAAAGGAPSARPSTAGADGPSSAQGA